MSKLALATQMIAHYNAQDADAVEAASSGAMRAAIATNPVTLNVFQGPTGRMRGAGRLGRTLASLLAIQRSGRRGTWTLNRVQGDEFGYGLT